MRFSRSVVVAMTMLWASTAWGDAPFASVSFFKEDGKGKRTPISSARLDDYVCITIVDNGTADGDHPLKLTIYDGAGREVWLAVSTVTAEHRRWDSTLCHGYSVKRDAPGTWWYVFELDGMPLLAKELVVRAVAPRRAG